MKQCHFYLSGPMTGVPDFNYPLFNRVATAYRKAGYSVFNPAESFDGDTGRDRTEYMRADIAALLRCGNVRVLPGWESSKGALLEIAIANAIGLPVAEIDPDTQQITKWDLGATLTKRVLEHVVYKLDGAGEPVQLPKHAAQPSTPTADEKPATSDAATPYDVVTGERQADYDHPYDNLGQTAALWNAQFTRKLKPGATFTAEDVCLGMILLKTSRESFKHKDDNVMDIHGYAHCIELIRGERARRNNRVKRGEFRWVGDDDDKGDA